MGLMGLEWMFISVFLGAVLRLLQIFSFTENPCLYFKNKNSFVKSILENCPILTSRFKPTLLWGKSGHFQTVVHVLMGKVKPKWPDSKRFHIKMPDGATMSYDLFDPHEEGEKAQFTLALCPGLANSSECTYLRRFSGHAQQHGYRVAILNHLGALRSETLTSPRVFTYGGTDELSVMIDHLKGQYPHTKIIMVGFSMGGNIVTKYLGENPTHQNDILCGVAVCQGFEINHAKNLFVQWSNLRRVYTYLMTLNMRRLLSRHKHLLFSKEAQKLFGCFKEDCVFNATSLYDIDENYSCIRAGYKSAHDYYKDSSSAYYLNNIQVPMLFVNALDDPVCPPDLLKYPREYVEKTDNCILITTKHGGHLGFFEGGVIVPERITWLDRVIIEYADGVASVYLKGEHPSQTIAVKQVEELSEREIIIDNSEDDSREVILRKREVNQEFTFERAVIDKEVEDKEKRDTLKRGEIIQQATSIVQ
ncbi:monoacylglycerol lipase ABHD2-like [Mya arenaria]|uniref:monoacylglycerol lipase ABHD2-like n=1 Tax=Mya arenaria TaxID=6604 RepID=UPI0022E61044|nr:monoacylglycerol lipase ABHD2-like [Mya arenaria]XP_052786921.1 monoacylglycerol lipase ABHD2-like [Mya arenaria]